MQAMNVSVTGQNLGYLTAAPVANLNVLTEPELQVAQVMDYLELYFLVLTLHFNQLKKNSIL